MEVIFSEDEYLILIFMRQMGKGHTNWMNGTVMTEDMIPLIGWEKERIEKGQEYLAGFGLVAPSRLSASIWTNYYLTPLGENFLRNLEYELQKKNVTTQPLSRSTFGKIWENSRGAVIEVGATVIAKLITGG